MVACTYFNFLIAAWRINYSYTGFCFSTIYLCYFLTDALDILCMSEREKIKLKKAKRRIPLPKKPPKVEEDKKVYNRRKEKEKIKRTIKGNGDK